MLTDFIGIVLVSFFTSLLFLLLSKGFFSKRNFLVSNGIPLIGGIGIALAFWGTVLFCSSLAASYPVEMKGIFFASLLLLVAGIHDDLKASSVIQKFLVQLVAASILVASGVRTNFVYINDFFNIVLSVFWIIGITNAINLLDVMDELAAGTALIAIFGFCIISFLSGDVLTLTLALGLGGAILAFSIFNFPPAKIYMGNSGSHFLGLLLAAMALTARYATLERPLALLTPLLMLGFPVFDTVFLILMRLKKGKSAFNKSNDHMALRFLHKGYTKRQTLFFMLPMALFFVVSGFLLAMAPNLTAAVILLLVGVVIVFLTKKMGSVVI